MGSASTLHVPFGDHMHQLDADQQDPGTAEGLEPQHWPRASLDRPMILLDHVVGIFALANHDGRFTIDIDRFESGEIGAALINRHGVGFTILLDRFLEIPPRCGLVTIGAQQEIDTPSTLGYVTHFGHIASSHLRYVRLVGGAATAARAIVFFRHDDGSWYVFPPLQVRPAMNLCYSTR
jgi:hypothetical protein